MMEMKDNSTLLLLLLTLMLKLWEVQKGKARFN